MQIVENIGARHGFPIIRVGMHTGPAVERDGYWFGAVVNVAARISGGASGGETLVSQTDPAEGDVARLDQDSADVLAALASAEHRCLAV